MGCRKANELEAQKSCGEWDMKTETTILYRVILGLCWGYIGVILDLGLRVLGLRKWHLGLGSRFGV